MQIPETAGPRIPPTAYPGTDYNHPYRPKFHFTSGKNWVPYARELLLVTPASQSSVARIWGVPDRDEPVPFED